MKKKTTSKRSVFQDPNFIRSLCKVVGALGFSCITFFTYTPKSSKSYFVLNFLKLDDFMFSTKTMCQMFSKLFKKVLSRKNWFLSQKRLNWLNRMRNRSTASSTGRGLGRPPAQSIEARVDSQLNRLRVQKTFSFFQNGCSTGQGLVEVQLRSGQGPMVTCQALNTNG